MPLKPRVPAAAFPLTSAAGSAAVWRMALAALVFMAAASGFAPAAQAATNPAAGQAKSTAKSAKASRAAKATLKAKRRTSVAAVPARPSYGQIAGLHATPDDLALKSSVALVIDQDTQEVLLQKNH